MTIIICKQSEYVLSWSHFYIFQISFLEVIVRYFLLADSNQ
jgi:hypothetical protein